MEEQKNIEKTSEAPELEIREDVDVNQETKKEEIQLGRADHNSRPVYRGAHCVFCDTICPLMGKQCCCHVPDRKFRRHARFHRKVRKVGDAGICSADDISVDRRSAAGILYHTDQRQPFRMVAGMYTVMGIVDDRSLDVLLDRQNTGKRHSRKDMHQRSASPDRGFFRKIRKAMHTCSETASFHFF